MNNSLYEHVIDKRTRPIGPSNWIANLRWMATEERLPLSYTFSTIPNTAEESDIRPDASDQIIGKRTLFGISISGVDDIGQYVYRPDCLEVTGNTFSYSLFLPFEEYGAIIKLKSPDASIIFKNSELAGRISKHRANINYRVDGNTIVIEDGLYAIIIKHNGNADIKNNCDTISISPAIDSMLVTISFHIDTGKALSVANSMFDNAQGTIATSRNYWENYLQSCPVMEYKEDYRYFNAYLDKDVVYSKDEILTRQLWHWAQVLLNISKVEFNDYTTYMAPDKSSWFGTWSNDGPESLCALACTNASKLVKESLVNYIRASINGDGVLSWYTHGFGQGCYGRVGDPGRYSHGVPNIIHTVEYYIRRTGDVSVLDEQISGGVTLWDKLKLYVTSVFEHRDINNDGLVEWCNLWETGWDDKAGPFFKKTVRSSKDTAADTVSQWVKVVTTQTPEDYEEFCEENRFPVTALVEQCFFLWALKSMTVLCDLKKDFELKAFCLQNYDNILDTIKQRHWNDQTKFYHDWDVRNKCLTDSKSLDAFFFMWFENDSERLSALIEHFNSPEEFGLVYPPTLSRDSADFNPDGYWCGGHWPRESTYLGLAFNKIGLKEKAEEIVLKAICSAKGKVLPENMNPLTGIDSTKITSMAYNALLVVALLEIKDENWTLFEYE